MHSEEYGTVAIPELDEEARMNPVRAWSDEELAVMNSYYNKITRASLVRYIKEHFPPGRSKTAVDNQAERMGLRPNGKKLRTVNPTP